MAEQEAEYVAALKVNLQGALDGEEFGPDAAQNVLDLVAKAGLVLVTVEDFEAMVNAYVMQQVRYGRFEEVAVSADGEGRDADA